MTLVRILALCEWLPVKHMDGLQGKYPSPCVLCTHKCKTSGVVSEMSEKLN
jgi:hypothetical protein